MLNWDDLRFFLSVARHGSVRGAATELGVSHSTVARRIEALEIDMGTRLFDRTPDGYQITAAGRKLMDPSERIDEQVSQIQRSLIGGDAKLSGDINVTLPDVCVTHIYLQDFADFCEEYPDITLNIESSYKMADLSRRDADVAIRILQHNSLPPDYLIGRKMAPIYQTQYASKAYLDKISPRDLKTRGRWLGWEAGVSAEKQSPSQEPVAPVWGTFPTVLLNLAACKASMGVSSLFCIVGDAEPDLVRVPGIETVTKRDLWLLTHPDLRETARIRVFREFIIKRTEAKLAALRGELA